MTAILTEPLIESRKSKIENLNYDRAIIALLTQPSIAEAARSCGLGESTLRRWLHQPDFAHAYSQARQQAFSVALGSLQNLSEQAVQTLQSLMQDPQISPSVRLSAARTILQMSFKAAQQFTLQARLDQLENSATALESEQEDCRPMWQSPIENQQSKIENLIGSVRSIQNRQSTIDNRTWWHKLGQVFHSVVEKKEDAGLNRSHSVKSPHPAANCSPLLPNLVEREGELLPPNLGGRGGEQGEGLNCSNPLHSTHQATDSSPLPCRGEVSSPACEQVGEKPSKEGDCSPPLARYERLGEGLGKRYDPLGEAQRAFLAYHRIPFGMRRVDERDKDQISNT